MRTIFEQQLKKVQDDILILGSMVEGAILDAVDVLKRQDMAGSQRLIQYDDKVNEKRFEIEHDTLTMIATQQPTAGDLRYLAAILEINTELERIGDYAKGIAVINVRIGNEPLIRPLVDIPKMADISMKMLHQALDALVKRDVDLAKKVALQDDEVDDLYNSVYRYLVQSMTQNPNAFDQATHLLWAAHNLERSADRVVNICERVIFTITGDMVEIIGPRPNNGHVG